MKIKFVPQDLWVGLYWKTEISDDVFNDGIYVWTTTYYLCLFPCLPIIWQRCIPVPAIVIQGLKGAKPK